ncbi:MAG: response regulator [Bacillota bacterium]
MRRGNLILIVDNNNQDLEILGKILNNNNYRIALAQEGQKALDFVENKKPDLILLDIMMPVIDGFEICKRLKANQWSADIPVIFMSAIDDVDKRLKAFAVGGVDYISKPFHEWEVLARVETQLNLSQTKQELEIKTEKQNILLNNIETQVWYLTDERTYGQANQSHAQFMGIEKEKIEGKSISDFLDPEATEICITGNREVFEKKKQVQKKEKLDNAQGEKRLLKIIKTPKLDENGRVKYVVCSAEDITEKEKLENELKIQNIELENLYSELEAELKKASQLHQQFLPVDLPVVEEMTYETYFQPSDNLGGDFYDIMKLQNQLLFYLADVSGHGLDSSMLNIFLRETINNYLLYEYDGEEKLAPSQLISYVAEQYGEENFPEDYFICLLVGVVDIEKMDITFANAGFQFGPLKISSQGEMLAVNCSGLPISAVVNNDLYDSDEQDVKVSLDKGDTLFLTTDGLLEERANDEIYGEDRLQEVLLNNYNFPVELITKRVKNDFSDFADCVNSQDDITFLCLQRDLDVIDSFTTTINSTIEEMYKIKEKLLGFVAPYYKPPSIICIGFQEILTNAIEHGNQKEVDKKVEIEVEVTTKYIKIVITDEGAGFDWQQVVKQDFDLERDLCNGECRGRGIKITNKAYDAIWYNEQGNQAHLYKLLDD